MTLVVTRDTRRLVIATQDALRLSQRELAAASGSSLRTVSRWMSGKSAPGAATLHQLAVRVHPRSPELARELAAAGGKTLEELGVVAPKGPPVEPPAVQAPQAPAAPLSLRLDAVVLAVAQAVEAQQGGPASIGSARAAVLAAFRRAREVGVTGEEIEAGLGGEAGKGSGRGRR